MSRKKKRPLGSTRSLPRMFVEDVQPWFGDALSYQGYREALSRMHGADMALYHNDDDDDEDGDNFGGDYRYMLSKHGDVAVMQVYGSMVSKESWLNRYFGMVSYEEMRNAAISAAESGAKALLIDYDTNGGSASGIGELSDFLIDFSNNVIPVYSYTGANMLSAGYWLGAVGKKVFSSTMALSGSIGVVSAHFSYHRAMKEQGVDVTMFRQGEFKALGSPYEQLDDKAKTEIEKRMGQFYDMFLGHVSERRGIAIPALIKSAAEGRVFMGADSRQVGLIDLVTPFDKAVSLVAEEVKGSKQTVITHLPTQQMMTGKTDMKRKLNQAGIAAVASGMDQALALADPTLSEEVTDESLEAEAAAQAAAQADADAAAAAQAAAAQTADQPATTADANLVDRLVALSAELATAKAEIVQLKQADQTRDGHFKTLIKIASDSTNRMELPLNRSQSNLKDASAETVINTYHAVLSDFNSKFKQGGVAEVAGEDNLSEAAKENTAAPKPSMVTL